MSYNNQRERLSALSDDEELRRIDIAEAVDARDYELGRLGFDYDNDEMEFRMRAKHRHERGWAR